jgi:hypothetical protein
MESDRVWVVFSTSGRASTRVKAGSAAEAKFATGKSRHRIAA